MSGGPRVADVMRTHVYRIEPAATVRAAAVELITHGIESLIVVRNDRVVGIVTERDLLHATLPSPQEIMGEEGISAASNLGEVAGGRLGTAVGHVMRRNVETIAPQASVTKALGTMLARRLRRLPVVEPNTGELVGVITQRDIFAMVFLGSESSPSAAASPARLVASSGERDG